MVSCVAPLSCPSPSCEAGLLHASLHAGGVKADSEGEGPPTRKEEVEEEEREKMQANPAYLPIEMMSYKSQESKYINVEDVCI